MAHIVLHKNHLYHNLGLLSKKAGGIEKIFAVLKDNAYGHGLELIAKEINKAGAIRVIVRDLEEALKIQHYFKEILVLSEKPQNFKPISKIIFAINSIEALKNVPKNTTIALKVDTGMHRNGIKIDDIYSACKIIKEKLLDFHSIFTHFRSADELGSEYFWQKRNFQEVKLIYNNIKNTYLMRDVFFHSSNSAALLRCNEIEDDFARVGIAMYGYNTLPKGFHKEILKPVMELFGEKMSQRVLHVNQKIGYGGAYTAKKDMIVSFYDIGYGDGVLRFNGTGQLKTTNGCLILGKTSMDGMSIESCADKISIFNDLTSWSQYFNTIPYEFLVNLSSKIKREFV